MRQLVFTSLFVGLCGLIPLGFSIGEGAAEPEARIEKVSVQYGYKRPFSFYYPYQYKFYYPQPNFPANARSCHWIYTNGTYVYQCS